MELTQEQIVEALSANSELLTGVSNHILSTDVGKSAVNNLAEQTFKDRIKDEVSNYWSRIDEDAFTHLGEKPKTLDDGSKQKTHEFLKDKFNELKELRDKKESLSKDAEVQRLNSVIDKLKQEGGGAHWQKTYENEKNTWLTEKEQLQQKIEQANSSIVDNQKQLDIDKGLIGLKFNEQIPKSAIDAMVSTAVNQLKQSSKIEDGKIIYLKPDGSRMNNPDYTPMSAGDVLKSVLKDILITKNKTGGGGAPDKIGTIVNTDVDGKSVKTLQLDESKVTSKSSFIQEVEKVLIAQGITRSNKLWDELTNEAYTRYNVKDMPR